MKPITAARRATPLVALLLLASCGSPESDCRQGIAALDKTLNAIAGSSDLASAASAVREELNTAKGLRKAGDYAGCVEAVGRGRAAIRAAQRTNQ